MAMTTVGPCKGYYPIRSLSDLNSTNCRLLSQNLAALAAEAVDVGACPSINFWGACDRSLSMITLLFVLFDETKKLMATLPAQSIQSGLGTDASGNYVSDDVGTIDIGSARYVAVLPLSVTYGTWSVYWRPYGLYKFPC